MLTCTPPIFSLTYLFKGIKLATGGLKIKEDLRQGSSGPILFPATHDPNDPHHPN